MKLGSKSDVFLQDGQTWFCSTSLQSDVTFEVGETSFHLHKFPLSSRSRILENLIQESSKRVEEKSCENQKFVVQLHELPGGSVTFLLIAKFCYGIKIELTPSNVVGLRCAAGYLNMTENYGERNLILETEKYLNEVYCDWDDTMRALRACEDIISYAESVNIVMRCIDSLAIKACQNFSKDWWYQDISSLSLPVYRKLILTCELRGMGPEKIFGCLMFYAKKYLPLMSRQSSCRKLICATDEPTLSFPTEADQRALLEEIVALLPDQKAIKSPTKLLLKLLRLCIVLNTTTSCRESLEKWVGSHLHEMDFEALLIPNAGYSVETLYDVDCVNRMINYFIAECEYLVNSDEGELIQDNRVLTSFKMVANIVDNYLAEVAPDVNLKLAKFISVAELIPDCARDVDDGLYRAIDIYLKAHPWLTDSERDQLCRLMNSKKLSLEATTHASQNERLPIRFISQILFVEQIRLRSSVSSWYFGPDKIENLNIQSGIVSFSKIGSSARYYSHNENDENDEEIGEFVNMKGRVFELEKQCLNMKKEIEKLERSKGKWNSFCKKFGNSMSFMSCSGKSSKRLENQIVKCKKHPSSNNYGG